MCCQLFFERHILSVELCLFLLLSLSVTPDSVILQRQPLGARDFSRASVLVRHNSLI